MHMEFNLFQFFMKILELYIIKVKMFSEELIDHLSQFIIRPHREVYGLDKLGPKKIIVKSSSLDCYVQIFRQECTILSAGKKIQLSIFQACEKPTSNTINPSSVGNQDQLNRPMVTQYNCTSQPKVQVTIFLHTNSGSRMQGLDYTKYLLQHGQTVCLFDYSGSGVSQGQYVTMGINQSIDLANIVQYLQERFGVQKVNLWGRSMGAVTAVLYCAKYPRNVRRMVLDSPFSDFRQLVKEIVNSRTGLPQFLFGAILHRIQEHLKTKLSVNMMDIDLKKQIVKPGMQRIPIFFLISKEDKLVQPVHVETLYELHKGFKKIIYLEGSHNKPRPTQIREQCADFLCNRFNNTSSQKTIEGPKKQYLNLLSRKYSQDTSATEKSKISSSSFVLNSSYANSQQFPNEPILFHNSKPPANEPFFINLMKKNRPQFQQSSTLSTPRQDHSLNKYNNSKISLSQLKKSQAVVITEQPPAVKCIPVGYFKGSLQFKKQSKTTMAIQYKNKIKEQINRV